MRRVSDVMTSEVIAVAPSTPFKELASLMAAYRFSALPVVDAARRVVGVVSEADLLLKAEYPGGDGAPLLERVRHRTERAKAAGSVAADVMSRPAVTVSPDATVAAAVKLLRAQGVKRLPVVDGSGRLVGIVSRGDLLKVFLRSDAEISQEILKDVIARRFLMDPTRFVVEVRDGVVKLRGRCERRSLIPVLERVVSAVDGVVGVDARLDYDRDLAEFGR